jgi:hypothetical protein
MLYNIEFQSIFKAKQTIYRKKLIIFDLHFAKWANLKICWPVIYSTTSITFFLCTENNNSNI